MIRCSAKGKPARFIIPAEYRDASALQRAVEIGGVTLSLRDFAELPNMVAVDYMDMRERMAEGSRD